MKIRAMQVISLEQTPAARLILAQISLRQRVMPVHLLLVRELMVAARLMYMMEVLGFS